MIYTPMTNAAMRLAYRAHHGQVDKSGIPYIFHPIHLAESMDDEISCTVALLHDVAEDTSVTMAELKAIFPREVTDALTLLTHDKNTDYFEYIRAIKNNPIARKVKLADLAHNSDQSRCCDSPLDDGRKAAWRSKYTLAKKILTED